LPARAAFAWIPQENAASSVTPALATPTAEGVSNNATSDHSLGAGQPSAFAANPSPAALSARQVANSIELPGRAAIARAPQDGVTQPSTASLSEPADGETSDEATSDQISDDVPLSVSPNTTAPATAAAGQVSNSIELPGRAAFAWLSQRSAPASIITHPTPSLAKALSKGAVSDGNTDLDQPSTPTSNATLLTASRQQVYNVPELPVRTAEQTTSDSRESAKLDKQGLDLPQPVTGQSIPFSTAGAQAPVLNPAFAGQETNSSQPAFSTGTSLTSADSTSGTSVASSQLRMNNADTENDFAGLTAQKLPTGTDAVSASTNYAGKATVRSVAGSSSLANSTFGQVPLLNALVGGAPLHASQSGTATETQTALAPSRVDQIEQMVTREALSIRQSGADSLAVSVKLDAHTDVALQLSNIGGQIQASLHCERGNLVVSDAQWSELRQSLAQHNIQLAPMGQSTNARDSQSQPKQDFSDQNTFKEQAASQDSRRQGRPAPVLPDALTPAQLVSASATNPDNNQPTTTTRGWESWA
jgi:hypothetical protein